MNVPGHILALAERLRTQDNQGTGWPMFCIQRKVRVSGIDASLGLEFEYYDRENSYAIPLRHSAAVAQAIADNKTEIELGNSIYQLAKLEAYGYKDEWHTVMACLTEQGAKDYIKANGHNLRGPDGEPPSVYVESFHRCQEMIQLREWLMTLKASPCSWRYDESDDAWDTSCGNKHQFTCDGPKENLHSFCPYCGNTIAGGSK